MGRLTPEEEKDIVLLPNDPTDQAIQAELAYLQSDGLTPEEEDAIQLLWAGSAGNGDDIEMRLPPNEEAQIELRLPDSEEAAIETRLSDAEEGQIEIDPPAWMTPQISRSERWETAPRLSPSEEAQIEIDGEQPAWMNPSISAGDRWERAPEATPADWTNPQISSADRWERNPAVTDPSAPGAAPQSTSQSGSVRMGGRGFGPDTGQGAVWAKGYEEFGRNDARLREMAEMGQLETAMGYEQLAEANRAKAQIEENYYRGLSELQRSKMDYLQESAELDKLMYDQARQESQQLLDNAMQQFAAVRQMAVQSPMGVIPGWQFAGASVAAFAQGFLAAQGIHINPIAQINRWEEMSIREQERQIQQAERGAQDSLNLWQIAKETSRDDLEARLRYRGMVIEQFAVATEMQAARFGSQLAMSSAEIVNSQLALERNNVLRQIRENYEKARLDNLAAMRDEMHKRVMERFAQEEKSLAWYRAKTDRMGVENKANKPGPTPLYIQDTRNVQRKDGKAVSGGQIVAYVDPNLPDGIQSKVYDTVTVAQQLHDNLQTGVDKLRELHQELDKTYGTGWMRKRQSPAYKRFDAERVRVAGDVRKFMTGLAGSIPEDNRILGQLEDDAWLQAGEDRLPTLIDDMADWGRTRFENSLKTPGVVIIPKDKRVHTTQIEVDSETKALRDARDPSAERLPSTIESLAGAATDKTRTVSGTPSRFYRQFVGAKDTPKSDQTGFLQKVENYNHGVADTKVWASQLERAAQAAIDPEKFLEGRRTRDPNAPGYEKAEEVRAQATRLLANTAAGRPLSPGQPAPPFERQRYAKRLLDMIEEDPQTLLKELSE